MPSPSPTLLPSSTTYPELPLLQQLEPYAQRLYDALQRLPDQGDALGKLIDSMAKPFAQGAYVRGLGSDRQPYQRALSVEEAPEWALAWLGGLVGVRIPVGTLATDARALILARSHQLRGKPETIKAVTRQFLAEPKYVFLEEQADGDPFHFRVYVRTTQATATEAEMKPAIAAVTPAGFTFELIFTDAVTWAELTGTWDDATGTWDNPGSPPAP